MSASLWGNLPFQRIYTGEKERFWSGGPGHDTQEYGVSLTHTSGPWYLKATVTRLL